MDTQSAINIINSPQEIKVVFNDAPVWLQSVKGDTVNVKFLDTNMEGNVPVSELKKIE